MQEGWIKFYKQVFGNRKIEISEMCKTGGCYRRRPSASSFFVMDLKVPMVHVFMRNRD